MNDVSAPLLSKRGLDFLSGGGECGRLMRGHDWAATALGPPAGWPQALKTLVGVMLAADQPMFVAWGSERLLLYNDRYTAMLADRHPRALGKPFLEVWADARDEIKPLVDRVFAGQPVQMADIELYLDRPGRPREAHFAFSYTPVRDEDGEVVALFCPCSETTDRVLADRAEAAAAERRRQMLQQMPEFIGILAGPNHVHDYVNDAYASILGSRDLVGRTALEMFPELVDQGFHARLDRVYATGEPFSANAMPLILPHEQGSRFIDMRFQPVLDDDGAVTGIFLSGYDVTERVRAEAELRDSEARVRLMSDAVPHMVWITAADGSNEFFNRQWEDYTGQHWEPTANEVAQSALHPDDRAETLAAFETSLASGDPFEIEHRIRSRTGEYRWFLARAEAQRDAKTGRLTRWYGASVDIHDRKRIEDELRASEAFNRGILQSSADSINVLDLDARLRFMSKGALVAREIDDFTSVEGMSWLDFWRGAEREAAFAAVEEARRGSTGQFRGFAETMKGSPRWWDVIVTSIADANGKPERLLAISRDITVSKQAEQALRLLNETLATRVAEASADLDRVWRAASDIFFVNDHDGVLRRVNPAATTILGWSEAELVGHSLFEFIHPDDLDATHVGLEHVRSQVLPRIENRYRTKSGEFRNISWAAAPEGTLIYGYGRDVTAERAREAELAVTQEALRQSQKMEAVGQLTGGIAHDFNNMLAVVIGSLDLLARRIGPDDTRANRYVEAARDGAQRAALLTQRLLSFSRQQPLKPEAVDVNQLVTGMEPLFRGSLGGDIRLDTVLTDDGWDTHVDPNQLENVPLNLAVNARDAMPDGGKLTIETRKAPLDARRAGEQLGLHEGEYVLIAVTDTGAGMTPEVIARAFDPFFTTKEVGKGTGLGLSQAYGFVRQSGGAVKIKSAPGLGTTVTIYLPRLVDVAPDWSDETGPTHPPLARSAEVILVVDDEPTVRRLSVDALTELGYRVLEADGAAEALRSLAAHPEIELMFTDVVMPEVNGRKLADEARARWPTLKVIFTTGYTRDVVVNNGVLDADVEVVGKPFTIEELASKVRRVLDGAPTAR